jgi:hypothetical protein
LLLVNRKLGVRSRLELVVFVCTDDSATNVNVKLAIEAQF